jgi:hypothetical protein
MYKMPESNTNTAPDKTCSVCHNALDHAGPSHVIKRKLMGFTETVRVCKTCSEDYYTKGE